MCLRASAACDGRSWYWRYPLAVEWALEWFVYRLRSLALFDLLELAGRATVLVASPSSGCSKPTTAPRNVTTAPGT